MMHIKTDKPRTAMPPAFAPHIDGRMSAVELDRLMGPRVLESPEQVRRRGGA